MSADQPIVVYTSCQDVADFVARFANRVSMTGLRLPNAFAIALGAPVRFEVRLADGTAALRGEGTVIDAADRGGSVAAPLRYELSVGHLRFDARNEVVYERILMLHEDRGEPATGEVNLHEVESSVGDRDDAPAMPPSRPPPSPPRGPVDASHGRGSAPPARGPSASDPRASAVPPPPAMRSPSGIPAPGGRPVPVASRVGPGTPGGARAETGSAIGNASPSRPSDPGGPLRRPAIGPSLPPRPSGPPRPAAASGGRFSPAAIARPPVSAPKPVSPVRAPAAAAGPDAGARLPTSAAAPAPRAAVASPFGSTPMSAPQPPIGFGAAARAAENEDRTDAAPPELSDAAPPVPAFSASRSSMQTPIANGFDDEDEDGPTSSHALPLAGGPLPPVSPPPLDIPEDGPPALARHHRDEPTWDAQIAAAPVSPSSSRPSSVPAPEFVPPRIVERYDASDELAPSPHDMTATTPGVVLDGPTSAGSSLPRFAGRTGPSGTIAGGTIPSATLPDETQIGLSLPGGRPITLIDPALMDGTTRQLSLDEADRLVRATRPSAPVGVPIAEDDVEEETHGEGLDGPTMPHDLRQLPAEDEDEDDE